MSSTQARTSAARFTAPWFNHTAMVSPRLARHVFGILVAIVGAPALHAQAPPAAANGCVACHTSLTHPRLATPAALFTQPDVHRESGFSCVDCHGGSATSTDAARAHAPAQGFRGRPAGQALVETCARCHSDATFMRRYAPRQRVDQAPEYASSVHGQLLAKGDRKVATCASCHHAHGIRRISDAKSPVFPTNVAATCAACHTDAARMAGYTLPGGAALPIHQLAEYQTSVHYAALTKANDLSAPTCNDCHGNHGAAPPGVGAITNVCGTCHAVFSQKFAASVHQPIFDKGCVECHGNHAVAAPSDQMLSAAAGGACAACHTAGDASDKGAAAAVAMRTGIERLKSGIDDSGALIRRLKNAGIEVSDEQLTLREASTKLTLARTEMHGFDVGRVEAILADGMRGVESVARAGQNGAAELRFRRRGLAASLAAILVFVVALSLKIRQIDRRDRERASS
jgi:predicted CXXCH cytochrome family protein